MGAHSDSPQKHPAVVGVSPGQRQHVVLQAARFAADVLVVPARAIGAGATGPGTRE
ncbi:hypothetical protein [Arthrobacter sp. zg-Y769]|uniref:hypothetical protein n=1 Tax=Arthrobacter sp. zg-Y769 TaxID=2894191 RepID=UPI001E4DE58E|nr:hypothetical protein [Arthrobacter sp. zg-Y769]MCC9205147.1 hypothetical protein [Arthrobacter sp. zg-Y769]